MTTTKTRIKAAQQAVNPPQALPLAVVYHDPESGRYWQTDEAGRGGWESEYSRYITPAALAELEKTHQVLRVVWTTAPLP
jgi:hypothetical protein